MAKTIHGMNGTPMSTRWQGMISRCHNPKTPDYKNYGGRGIIVCDEWRTSFASFYRDMGDVPFKGAQIDRIDNNKGYCKENCRWATPKQNSNNTRANRYISCDGVTLSVALWADRLKIATHLIQSRLGKDMTDEEVISKLVRGEPFTRRVKRNKKLQARHIYTRKVKNQN